MLDSAFSAYCFQNIAPENRPFVEPAKKARRAFRQPNVAKAAINMKRIQNVLESRAHELLSKQQRVLGL
jgi:hypothetical protein